jgi:predicted RNA-binding protein
LTNYWLVVGSPENWTTAFEQGNIWGLKETQRYLWERLNENDVLLFYATQPVGGIIGHGKVRTKFKQNQPLWPQEVREYKVIWPLRFEFDVGACLPPRKWKTEKLISNVLRPRSGFQLLTRDVAEGLMSLPQAREYVAKRAKPSSIAERHTEFATVLERPMETVSDHDQVKKLVVEIGRLQGFIAEEEYPFDLGKLDVVWRRVELSVPTYVFEVQVGGDVYHALAKLKHAFDLWNSHVYVIARQADYGKVKALLAGTFHEIGGRLKFIELDKIDELHKRKRAYLDLERELGM